MLNLTKTATIPAKSVEIDDWFKFGGQTYRVTNTDKFFDKVTLTAVLYHTALSISIGMDASTPITIYNQQ